MASVKICKITKQPSTFVTKLDYDKLIGIEHIGNAIKSNLNTCKEVFDQLYILIKENIWVDYLVYDEMQYSYYNEINELQGVADLYTYFINNNRDVSEIQSYPERFNNATEAFERWTTLIYALNNTPPTEITEFHPNMAIFYTEAELVDIKKMVDAILLFHGYLNKEANYEVLNMTKKLNPFVTQLTQALGM